jgi:hypothetical protein
MADNSNRAHGAWRSKQGVTYVQEVRREGGESWWCGNFRFCISFDVFAMFASEMVSFLVAFSWFYTSDFHIVYNEHCEVSFNNVQGEHVLMASDEWQRREERWSLWVA